MGGQVGSKANHGKASILEFLHAHVLFLCGIQFIPLPEPIENGFSLSSEGLAIELLSVLVGLKDSADQKELCPPLGIGLQDGVNGVRGGHIVRLEGAHNLRPEPTHVGKHGGAAVG